jgi:transposase-like protein
MTRPVVVSVEAKRSALDRIANGEAVSAVAADLGIHRQRLYYWQTRVRKDGLKALRGPGRPPKPVLDKRPHPHRSVLLMAALQELVARLALTTGDPPGDSR